jgi:gliding motility-associated lipoprotein GldD
MLLRYSVSRYAFSNTLLLLLFAVVAFTACEENTAVPRPRAYPRVVYPKKEYAPFNEGYCDFTFDLPKYARVDHDTMFFNEKAKSDCWFNILVPGLNAKIYCSYYPISDRKDFDGLVKDAYEMTNKHNIKASFIEELPIHRKEDHVHGVVFNVEGPAASSYQFFLSDSTRHFLRGALYFNTQARPDSLAPVVAFMKTDLDRLVRTLKWGK